MIICIIEVKFSQYKNNKLATLHFAFLTNICPEAYIKICFVSIVTLQFPLMYPLGVMLTAVDMS